MLNARSGTAVLRADPRPTIAERLPDALVYEFGENDDLAAAVADHMAVGPRAVLGVYGGDGTVSRVAHLARQHDVPLLALPGGTFNHFARAIGVDDVGTAIDSFQAGSVRTVTIAQATADGDPPLTALNAVSIGTYAAFLEQREQREPALGKWLGGVVAAWMAMRGARPVTIVRDGRRARVWSVFVGVGRNDPDRLATMQRESIDDGTLDVRIHHARGSRLRAMASLVFGRRTAAALRALGLMPPKSDVERIVGPSFEMQIRAAEGMPSAFVHDGELEERDPAGFTLRCVAIASALRVYARAP